jgi:hypothetical protein
MSIKVLLNYISLQGGDLAGDYTDQLHTLVTSNLVLAISSIVAGK